MLRHNNCTSTSVAAMFLSIITCVANAQSYDSSPAWPLCGRLTEDPNETWNALTDPDCPAYRHGDAAYSDVDSDGRFGSTFGPRLLYSDNLRYDFHRGLDISTPTGTPAFAIADGVVYDAGVRSGYSDPVIIVRHFRPGYTSCSSVGCYHAMYLHMSGWDPVATGDVVTKGQLLGYTGASASGYQHLHFEIRDAPAADPFSIWQRDCIHPLGVLPYASAAAWTVSIDSVTMGADGEPDVVMTVTGARDDVARVEVKMTDDSGVVVAQPGDTPNALGYYVEPAFFDFDTWNFQYTHKNSASVPWASFGEGGAYECPYQAVHGASYSAHVHLDQADPSDAQVGLFNGVRVQTVQHSQGDYWLKVAFQALRGPASCVTATATLTGGTTQETTWCGFPTSVPVAPPTLSCISLSTWSDVQCGSSCDSNSCHKKCASKCSNECACNSGGPVLAPAPAPMPAPGPVPAPAPEPVSPPTGSCGKNRSPCTLDIECCSENCKGFSCKGG